MTTISVDQILSFNPCTPYKDRRYLRNIFPKSSDKAPVLHFLTWNHIPIHHRLWVVSRQPFLIRPQMADLAEKIVEIFRVHCFDVPHRDPDHKARLIKKYEQSKKYYFGTDGIDVKNTPEERFIGVHYCMIDDFPRRIKRRILNMVIVVMENSGH